MREAHLSVGARGRLGGSLLVSISVSAYICCVLSEWCSLTTGIETSNIVESTGTRPRRAAAAAFIEAQQGKEDRREQEDSDDEESLIAVPLAPKAAPGRYNLADSDSD